MKSRQGTITELFSAAAFRFAQASAWHDQVRPSVRAQGGEGNRLFEAGNLPRREADAAAITRMLEVVRKTDERLLSAVRLLSEVSHAYARDMAREQGRWVGVHARRGVAPSDEQRTDTTLRIAHLDQVRHAAHAHEVAMSELLNAAATMSFKADGTFVREMSRFRQNRFLEALNMATAEMALAAVFPEAIDLHELPVADDPFWRELENYHGRPINELQPQGRPAEVLGARWNGEEFRLFQFCGAAVRREAYVTAQARRLAKLNPFGLDDEQTAMAIDGLREASEKELACLQHAGLLAPMPKAQPLVNSVEAAFVGRTGSLAVSILDAPTLMSSRVG